jgi:hypothetical protein
MQRWHRLKSQPNSSTKRVATLIAIELLKILGPSRPPKLTARQARANPCPDNIAAMPCQSHRLPGGFSPQKVIHFPTKGHPSMQHRCPASSLITRRP